MVFSYLNQETLKIIFDMFITSVCYLKDIWAYLFNQNAPRIQKVNLVYVRDDVQDSEDVTLEYKMGGAQCVLKDASKDVTDMFFEVTYKIGENKYVYVTRDPNHVFPPPKPPMSFRVQIKDAFLLDSSGVAMYCITKEAKMYEGPHYDFHGETIRLRDLDINEPECEAVRFVNAIGTVTEYSLEHDSISHQTIWSPSKTSTLQDWQHCTLEQENDSPPPA
jgi:hypothetical protein